MAIIIATLVFIIIISALYYYTRRTPSAASTASVSGSSYLFYNSRKHPFVGLYAAGKRRPNRILGVVTRVEKSGRVSVVVNAKTGDRVRRQISRLDVPARNANG